MMVSFFDKRGLLNEEARKEAKFLMRLKQEKRAEYIGLNFPEKVPVQFMDKLPDTPEEKKEAMESMLKNVERINESKQEHLQKTAHIDTIRLGFLDELEKRCGHFFRHKGIDWKKVRKIILLEARKVKSNQ